MSNSNTNITLRHGIAPPQFVQLSAAQMEKLATLPADAGLNYLLRHTPNLNGFEKAVRQTLHDPHSLVEIRQNDAVKVLTQKQLPQERIVHPKDEPFSTIEIGVSKAQAGG
jgi:hypothetical protein